jgi:activator of 2-hydroxyglutaryl-CoA dehydratase
MGDSVPEMSDRFSRELGFYTQSELRSQSSQAMLQAFADKRKSIKPATERCLYIGIDFGTT